MEQAQWLYRVQPTRANMLTDGPTREEQEIVGAHFAYLKGLVGQGVVLLAGRTLNNDPSSFGIVIFLAENESQAREVMRSDPAVSRGVMKAELFPYRIALVSGQLV